MLKAKTRYINMDQKELTIEELEKALNKVIDFDNELYFNLTLDGLRRGRTVVVDAVTYLGAGNYTKKSLKNRYKYKLIVPIVSKEGELYSTDLFKDDVKNAIQGEYGIYYTQQKVVDVVAEIETDFSESRFGHGYTQEKYGFFKLVIKDNNISKCCGSSIINSRCSDCRENI